MTEGPVFQSSSLRHVSFAAAVGTAALWPWTTNIEAMGGLLSAADEHPQSTGTTVDCNWLRLQMASDSHVLTIFNLWELQK